MRRFIYPLGAYARRPLFLVMWLIYFDMAKNASKSCDSVESTTELQPISITCNSLYTNGIVLRAVMMQVVTLENIRPDNCADQLAELSVRPSMTDWVATSQLSGKFAKKCSLICGISWSHVSKNVFHPVSVLGSRTLPLGRWRQGNVVSSWHWCDVA